MSEDPRLRNITVQMLLHHSGGWNRKKSGDPIQWGPRIRGALGLNHPPTIMEMVRYMKGVPLDFAPGTDVEYSNFGFVLLGAIIMKLTKQEYGPAVQQLMLRPMGVQRMRIDGPPPQYVAGEAHRYLAEGIRPLPGGVEPMIIPATGWLADCVDLAWMMTAIDGSRTGSPFLSPAMLRAMVSPPPGLPLSQNGTTGLLRTAYYGLGWVDVRPPQAGNAATDDNPLAGYEYLKYGDFNGIGTLVQHLPNGTNLVALFNTRPGHEGPELSPSKGLQTSAPEKMIQPLLLPRLRSLSAWPEGDLFSQT
jgi:CubicO group peptidase (beta-lactamase class C family)